MLFEQLQTGDKCRSDCIARNSMKLQKRHRGPVLCVCVIYVQDVLLIFKDIDNGASAQPSPGCQFFWLSQSQAPPHPLVHVSVLW